MAGFEVLVSGSSFSKRIGLCESGRDLSALGQVSQDAEIFFVNVDAKDGKLLVVEFRTKAGGEHAEEPGQGLFMHARPAYCCYHTDAAGLEDAPPFRKRMIVDQI